MNIRRPLFAVCLGVAAILAVWVLFFTPTIPDYGEYDGREAAVTGRVVRKEYRTSFEKKQIYLYLSNCSVVFIPENSPEDPEKELKLNIMCVLASGEAEPAVGSCVSLQGELESFDGATNPGEFDSRLYYAGQGIDMRLDKAALLWQGAERSVLGEGLWQLRCAAGEKLDSLLGVQDASVLKTMLLGDRETLDSELKSLYRETGIAHILAVSGLHISLIGLGAYRLLRRLRVPVCISVPIAVFLICAYGILTGAGLSAIRAVGMFMVRMLGDVLGRTYDLSTALGLLFALMGVSQPLYFLNSGFLLSFGSLLGIGCLYPALERGYRENPRFRQGAARLLHRFFGGLRKSFWAGLCVTLATLPVQMWYYYELPLYSVLVNLLVLPLVTALVYCGVGLLALPAGFWCLPSVWVIHNILSFYEWLCIQSGKLPGSTWICGKPQVWQITVYIGILTLLVLLQRQLKRRWRLGILAAALLVICVRPEQGFQVTFLDVGQGDSICLELENGANYLIDCGSSSQRNVGQYQVAPFLKHQGIDYLDGIFITHPDQDHCNGLETLLEEGYAGRIGKLLLPGIASSERPEELGELIDLARAYEIPVYYMVAGMQWQEGETVLACLHPPEGYAGSESNVYSQVLFLRQNDFSMLLTGDVEGAGERLLAEELERWGIEDITLLKVAHHGSSGTSSPDFLQQVSPELAVISCGRDNSYGHPHPETLERLETVGSRVLVTTEYGAIMVKVKGGEVRVYGFGK